MPRRYILALWLAYVGLSGLALNRLVLGIDRYVGIGQGQFTDYYHAHWNYWWIRHALSEPGLRVYETNYILFPYDLNLSLHTLAEFWFPLWALVEPLSNHFVALNVILWAALALTGLAGYAFLRGQGAAPLLAFIGGAWLMLLPQLTWSAAMTLPQYVAGFWFVLPFALWHQVATTRRVGWALLLGLAFWGMLLTDRSSLLVVALGLAPYALWTLYDTPAPERVRLLALGLLPFGVLAALGWFIAPLQAMLAFDRSTLSPADLDSTHKFALPLRGLLGYDGDTDDGIGLLIGLLTLFSVFVPSRDRVRWVWLGLGAWMMLLALGPYLPLNETRIPLPFRAVYEVTDGVFRAVARFAIVGVACWLVFLARTWSPYVQGWGPRARLALGSLLLLGMVADLRVMQPFEAGPPLPAYDFHQTMRADEDDYVVIDVPVSVASGWISYGNFQAAQFYAITHEKRTTNGLVARLPGDVYGFFRFNPTMGWLGGFQSLDADHVRAELGEFVDLWGVGYLAVYQAYLAPGQAEPMFGFLNTLDYLCPAATERDAVFYRTRAHAGFAACPPRYAPLIDLGQPDDAPYLGEGFHRAENIGGADARWLGTTDQATLRIDFAPETVYTLALHALAFAEPQVVTVWVEGQLIGTFTATPDAYQTFTLTLPALTEGARWLRLDYPPPESPAARGLSPDTRPLSIALDWLRLRPLNGANE